MNKKTLSQCPKDACVYNASHRFVVVVEDCVQLCKIFLYLKFYASLVVFL